MSTNVGVPENVPSISIRSASPVVRFTSSAITPALPFSRFVFAPPLVKVATWKGAVPSTLRMSMLPVLTIVSSPLTRVPAASESVPSLVSTSRPPPKSESAAENAMRAPVSLTTVVSPAPASNTASSRTVALLSVADAPARVAMMSAASTTMPSASANVTSRPPLAKAVPPAETSPPTVTVPPAPETSKAVPATSVAPRTSTVTGPFALRATTPLSPTSPATSTTTFPLASASTAVRPGEPSVIDPATTAIVPDGLRAATPSGLASTTAFGPSATTRRSARTGPEGAVPPVRT